MFEPQNPDYGEQVRASFERQRFMDHIGAELVAVGPGRCEIRLPYRPELTQQHGYFHGGVVGTLADNAGGYAAFSLLPAGASIVTVEYKLNIVAPGRGEALVARGQVIRAGRTLIVSRAEVFAVEEGGAERLCAASLQTLLGLLDRPDEAGAAPRAPRNDDDGPPPRAAAG
jgi:uncharacterized protein (TIGR00369 family)